MVKKCPKCGGVVEQVISAPAVQFKGSGWYVTDYRQKPAGSDSGQKSGAGEDSGAKKDAKPKPDAAPKSEKK